MHVVRAGFGNDVDARASRSAQIGGVVAAIHLEFLHRVLAQGEAHATGIVVGFTTVDGHAVSPAIASVKRKPALRRLLHSKILVIGEPRGIRHTRHQQRETQVIAAVNRKIRDVPVGQRVCFAAALRFHHGRLRVHFDGLRCRRHLQLKIHDDCPAYRDSHILLDHGLKSRDLCGYAVCSWREPNEFIFARMVARRSASDSRVDLHRSDCCLRYRRPRGIRYGSGDIAGGAHALRARHARPEQQADQQADQHTYQQAD